GKIAPSWNFGTLHALTAKETADLYGSGVFSSTEVEPLTYYGVVRSLKEFREQRHGLGFMTSVVARSTDDPALRDQLNRTSVQAGLDGWHFLDSKKLWVVSGWAVSSLVQGTAARIAAVQTDARHYLQRPDRGSFRVDSSATSMLGYGARMWLNKQSGHLLFNSGLGFMNPRFDVNDLGFQSRADVINGHIGTGYQWTNVTSWRKNANVLGAVFDSHDFDGNQVWGGVWTRTQIEIINNYSLNTSFAYNQQTINNRRTRVGQLTHNMHDKTLYIYINTM